ncbi:MAG: hypothetical protein JNM45_12590 [Rhizobiales bacterium]|nr:hypothetical protein [Hyphomicrobiales bacterium]
MRKFLLIATLLAATPALAQDAALNFNIGKLCAWQHENNSMDVAECTAMEKAAQQDVATLEATADAGRKEECVAEARNYSGDSGFASFTVYASCLKSGPGGL